MGIVCIDGTEANQAIHDSHTQPENNACGYGTYNVCMEDDLANGVRGAGYQEIDSELEIIVEI